MDQKRQSIQMVQHVLSRSDDVTMDWVEWRKEVLALLDSVSMGNVEVDTSAAVPNRGSAEPPVDEGMLVAAEVNPCQSERLDKGAYIAEICPQPNR